VHLFTTPSTMRRPDWRRTAHGNIAIEVAL
jgi:hypothetical protein